MVPVVLLAALLAGDEAVAGAVKVEGGGGCPTPADVAGRLGPLLPPGPAEATPRRAVLTRDGRELRVELRDAEGALLAHRRLAAGACGDLAAAAAVVIATWEVELRGRGVLGLWPEGPPARPADPPPVVARASPPPPPPPASDRQLVLGAAAVGVAAPSGGVAPGLIVEARGGRVGRRLGGALALSFDADRSVPLAGGSVAWRRAALLAALSGRWPSRSGILALEVDAGVMAALLSVHGLGFSRDDAVSVLDPGAALAARLTLRARMLQPWVGAGLRVWPIAHEAAVQGATGAAGALDLPRGEVFVALGLALRLRP